MVAILRGRVKRSPIWDGHPVAVVCLRLSESHNKAVEYAAARAGVGRPELIRRIIDGWVNGAEKKS